MPPAGRFKILKERLRVRKAAVKAKTLETRLSSLKRAPLVTLDNVIRSRPPRLREDTIQEPDGTGNSLPWSILQPYDGTPCPAPPRLQPPITRAGGPVRRHQIKSALRIGRGRPVRPSIYRDSTGGRTKPIHSSIHQDGPGRRSLRFPRDFSSIRDVREALGINSDTKRSRLVQDVIFVAIDTEFQRHGFFEYAVEVGISILDTRDLHGVSPGAYLTDWVRRMKHRSIIVDRTPKRKVRRRQSLFSTSEIMSVEETKQAIKRTLSSAVAKFHLLPPPAVILVGQSILGDIQVLRNDGIDLLEHSGAGVHFDSVIDTAHPSQTLRNFRRSIPSGQLGKMLQSLGVMPGYATSSNYGPTIMGLHQAGNDAAYTMMVLLLFALRWDELARGEGLETLKRDHPLWSRALLAPEATYLAPREALLAPGEVSLAPREVPTTASWWVEGWRSFARLFRPAQ